MDSPGTTKDLPLVSCSPLHVQVFVEPRGQFGAASLHRHLLCLPSLAPPSVSTPSVFRTACIPCGGVLDSSCFPDLHEACVFYPVFHGSFCIVPTAKPLARADHCISHMLQQVIQQPCVANMLPCLFSQSRPQNGSAWLCSTFVHDVNQLQLCGLVPSHPIQKNM